ncbi:MAG: ATP-binding cassette domain-containing protein [Clostridiales bacterium]|nr:ATP-binding cassette domain-containing protein [Clostridiales bacterium]MDY5467867.1 ATP-binding cassette domain-containing protein [Eubacteriales bacterium]
MLEVKNIRKIYNPGTVQEKCLFDDFSLSIPDGQFVSVVGSNGSGKTSLLNLICGSIQPDGGQILMQGRDIRKDSEHVRARKIGRVYQNPAMGTCAQMTILENLSLADFKGKPAGLHRGTDRRRIDAYREMLRPLGLGLEDMLSAKVGTLSGGQRQALALLMSTMTPISFLILDEHTAALDPKTADIIMELTGRVVREKQLTAIMVTHNLRYAVEYGDRILMMHQGHAVLDKAGEEKQAVRIEDLLTIFNEISIECGN